MKEKSKCKPPFVAMCDWHLKSTKQYADMQGMQEILKRPFHWNSIELRKLRRIGIVFKLTLSNPFAHMNKKERDKDYG